MDLARGMDPSEFAVASASLRVRVIVAEPGPWCLEGFMTSEPGHLGLLVLNGLVMRTVEVGGRNWVDLLDCGNVLRPWDPLDDHAGPLEIDTSWTVVAPTRLAVLDHRFAAVAARWPVLMERLLIRSLCHSRWLATLLAINSRPRVDERLLLLFRHLAARFGRVTPDGIVVEVPLTHELLSQIVAVQRQSVSLALSALAK
ncbi:MAG: hypothetical protein ACRDSJ_22280, partial [Rubrobacteraceae bacterium]